MIKKLFILLCLCCIGIGSAWGTEAKLTLSSTTKFGTTSGSTLKDNQGNTWTCTGTSIQNSYQSSYSGQQFGTSSTNYSYTFTSSISGTITSVSITAAAGGTTAKYDISVGGTSFKSGNLSKTSTAYIATVNSTGNIVITLDQNSGSKAVYLGSITVVYSTGPTNPIITFKDGEVMAGKDLNLSSLFTSNNKEGAVTYEIIDTDGEGAGTIEGNILHATAPGMIEVKATQAAVEGKFNAGNATAYITINEAKVLTSIELSGEYPNTFWKGDDFSHNGIKVTAHYDIGTTADVTASSTFTGYNMNTAGQQTVTVTYVEEEVSKTAEYNITINTIGNTLATAYTPSQAMALIEAGKDLATAVYVKGTVSKIVTAFDESYGNISFDVSADGTTTGDQFQFYRNFKAADKAKWTSATEAPCMGDDVVGYGTMKKCTKDGVANYEFNEGNYVVSHVRATTLIINDVTVDKGSEVKPTITTNRTSEYTVSYTSDNTDIVDIVEGKLMAKAVGTATITASVEAEANAYKAAETAFVVTVIPSLTSIEVKTSPFTEYKDGDKFNPTGLVITCNYDGADPNDVEYSDDTKKNFVFTPSLTEALKPSVTSVTISYLGKSADLPISVRELYSYTMTWMANGVDFTTTEVTEGSTLELPTTTPPSIGDMVFKGWTASETVDADGTGIKYVTNEISPTENTTFYAVYAKEEEGEPKETEFSFDTSNFTEISTSYTKTFTHTFPEATVEAYGVYKNGGIQMNTGKGTYIKNTTAMPGYISKIVLTWKASGNNSVTMYANSSNVASKSSDNLGKQSTTTTTHTINIDNAEDKDYKYFYLDGTTVAGACVITKFSVYYMIASTIYSNYTTSVASANMSITSAKWGTFCAPFDVELEDGVKAYTATETNGEVTFSEVTTTIPAGTPVVVYSETEVNQNFVGVLEKTESTCQAGALVGVYTATSDIPATTATNQNYVLQKNAAGVGFYKANNNISLKANRCYMTLPATSGAKESFLFDEVVTGINTILNNKDKSVEGIFDLNGRRLPAPRKGVNIINGVKVIVK